MSVSGRRRPRCGRGTRADRGPGRRGLEAARGRPRAPDTRRSWVEDRKIASIACTWPAGSRPTSVAVNVEKKNDAAFEWIRAVRAGGVAEYSGSKERPRTGAARHPPRFAPGLGELRRDVSGGRPGPCSPEAVGAARSAVQTREQDHYFTNPERRGRAFDVGRARPRRRSAPS